MRFIDELMMALSSAWHVIKDTVGRLWESYLIVALISFALGYWVGVSR